MSEPAPTTRAGWLLPARSPKLPIMKSFHLSIAVTVLAAGALGVLAATEPSKGSLEGWTSLTLGAEKAMIFSATATMTVEKAAYKKTGKPAILFKTHSKVRLLGATGFEEETTSWIDTEGRRALEFFQFRPSDSARRYLFMDGFIRQTNWEPPEDNPGIEFDKWRETETNDRRFTYADGTTLKTGESPTDSYSLLYLLRDLDLASQTTAPREFTTIYRRHLMRIRIVPGEHRRNQREVVNEATGNTEKLNLLERRVKVKPIGEGASSYKGLAGMQGETEIWVDERSGALVEIDGDAPGFGNTEIVLKSFRR